MRDLNPIVGLSGAAVKEPDNERTAYPKEARRYLGFGRGK